MVLAINTATRETQIAILKDGEILAEKSWPSYNNEAEMLMPEIQNLLNENSFDEIQKVIVLKGPGSFTGLRVGITVANTMAYLLGAKLHAVDTFEYFWKKLSLDKRKNTALLIFAGKRGVYADLGNDSELENVNINDLNQFLKNNKIEKVFGDISNEQREILDISFLDLTESFAKTILKFDLENFENLQIVQPRYVKPPSITKPKPKI